jgi:hypothetical protein
LNDDTSEQGEASIRQEEDEEDEDQEELDDDGAIDTSRDTQFGAQDFEDDGEGESAAADDNDEDGSS